MTVDLSEFEAGAEWAYRLRDNAPSECVRVLRLFPRKTRASSRIEVEFVHREERPIEEVPPGRLRVLWADVEAFDLLMANWARIDDTRLDDSEQAALWTVFEQLVPETIAETGWDPVRDHLRIHTPDRLPELGIDLHTITDQVEWFADGEVIVTSPAGALLLAEAACTSNPTPVLEWVMEEETELREKCKRGSTRRNLENQTESTSPGSEYHWYLLLHRPVHEIIRQWCGYRAVTFQERLAAAETETRRLDVLLARAIDDLKASGKDMFAGILEEEHERHRITPARVRPIVERPLSPSELPVRYITQPRRWGY